MGAIEIPELATPEYCFVKLGGVFFGPDGMPCVALVRLGALD